MSTPTSRPYDELCRLYGQCPSRNMAADLLYYLRDGHVFASPTHMLIGERVGDGWHIHVAIGTGCLKKFCELMPYWLPYVGWAREHKPGRQRVVWHRTEDVFRKVGYTYGRTFPETTAPSASPEQVVGGIQCEATGRGSQEAARFSVHYPGSFEHCPTAGD